jgi:hypothetical protein
MAEKKNGGRYLVWLVGLFGPKSAIAVAMPIATAFKL